MTEQERTRSELLGEAAALIKMTLDVIDVKKAMAEWVIKFEKYMENKS